MDLKAPITSPSTSSAMDPIIVSEESVQLPQESKGARYYYRHREEILERRRLKRNEDPVFAARQREKEEKRRLKEEAAKERALKKQERLAKCAERWGSSGATKT